MLKYFLGLLLAVSTVVIHDAPQAEARFGSRYASAPGWRPGKLLIRFRHANAERRANRRAEGRGLFPGRMTSQASCGSCAVATRPVAAACPSCPPTVPAAPKDCPTGVCPKN